MKTRISAANEFNTARGKMTAEVKFSWLYLRSSNLLWNSPTFLVPNTLKLHRFGARNLAIAPT